MWKLFLAKIELAITATRRDQRCELKLELKVNRRDSWNEFQAVPLAQLLVTGLAANAHSHQLVALGTTLRLAGQFQFGTWT